MSAVRAEVIERAALRNRDIAALIAVSELFLDRLHTIIAVPATLLRKRFVEVIVQYFPAAGAALPVEHHLLEFLVFLLVSLLALLHDLVDFSSTEICFYELEFGVMNFADHTSVFEQRQTDANLGFRHTRRGCLERIHRNSLSIGATRWGP